eukprot:GEMP01033898.1.p1 GENE.GEMP01033898.1~~GEMP01033898.1.p1  ORF type:complete len:466 (+),score=110.75 GEMP01033898.1:616-2013(+)
MQHNPAALAEMGCHQKETKLFVSQKANGIMGLAVSSNRAKPSILQNLFHTTDASMFALCLAQEGGVLRVGGKQAFYTETTPGLQWMETGRMNGAYRAPLDIVTVDGTNFRQVGGFGRTIIDSGTTFTYFPSSIFRTMKRSLADFCKTHHLPCTYGNCFSMTPNQREEFPTLRLTFGKLVTNWFPHSYLYPAGSTKKYCYGFEDNGHHAGTVLGATWMIDHELVFDISKGRIGIADVTCPRYASRPNPPTASDFAGETPAPAPVPTPAPTSAPTAPAKPSETRPVSPKAEKKHAPTPQWPAQTATPVPKTPGRVAPKPQTIEKAAWKPKTPETSPGKPAPGREPPGSTNPNRPIFGGLAGGYVIPTYVSNAASILSVLLLVLATLNLARWWRRRRITNGTIPLEDWLERGEFPDEATNGDDTSDFIFDDIVVQVNDIAGVGNGVVEGDDGAGIGDDIFVLNDSDID